MIINLVRWAFSCKNDCKGNKIHHIFRSICHAQWAYRNWIFHFTILLHWTWKIGSKFKIQIHEFVYILMIFFYSYKTFNLPRQRSIEMVKCMYSIRHMNRKLISIRRIDNRLSTLHANIIATPILAMAFSCNHVWLLVCTVNFFSTQNRYDLQTALWTYENLLKSIKISIFLINIHIKIPKTD